jgi:PBSX family phage terminase large subunit
MNSFVPHKYQAMVLAAPERFINAIAGKQSGKTMVGPVWLCQEIYKNFEASKRGDYLITAPTNKILQQAALPKFKDVMPSDWGEWKEQRQVFELVWGDKIYVRSADEPKHIESMTLRAVWGDEAGQFKSQVHDNIQARLAIYLGRSLYTTTPYTANWLKREVLKKAGRINEEKVPTGQKDICVINWTSADNPYFSKDEFERLRATLPSAVFERDYEGKFTQLQGLVFPDFDEDEHVVHPFEIDNTWKRFGGMDFGNEEPTAIIPIAEDKSVSPSVFYVYKEFYKSHSRISHWVDFINGEGLQRVEADPQSKQLISELAGQGCPVTKANNDIDSGLLRLTELFKTKRLKIFSHCHNLIDELGTYHYPAPSEEKVRKDKPVSYNDHAIDALRYAFAKNYGGSQVYSSQESRVASKKQFVRGMVFRTRRDVDPFTNY